ncbi:MAG: 2-ketoisovalerate ferredoxin oxidoreductase [Deltaproteobacteria bacterium HGW-Deltaproteobacteria-21]|nr:MAG: 2-ketoisovalerate ferredoxin oxidoreductase [Deltaproteobacteria bacterium HGW-Deltaproteobacteria-21]
MNEQAREKRDLFTPGHYGCPGCGAALAMRQTLSVLGEDTIIVMPAGCWSTFIGIYPYSCLSVPVLSVAFASTAAVAAGVKSGLEIQGNDHTTVLAWAGDGGTFDIGLQALSGAVERNEDILFICYDNEAYMNTGIQRSSATPAGGWTTTTPDSARKSQRKKNIVEIMAAHRIPYAATACIGAPADLADKVEKAKTIKGSRFIHLFASCPTGWRHAPELTLEVARQAIKSRVFPLYEVFDGDTWKLSPMPDKEAVNAYLKHQGRFKKLSGAEHQHLQKQVDDDWERLLHKCRDAP